jgi:hypothetical protein
VDYENGSRVRPDDALKIVVNIKFIGAWRVKRSVTKPSSAKSSPFEPKFAQFRATALTLSSLNHLSSWRQCFVQDRVAIKIRRHQ